MISHEDWLHSHHTVELVRYLEKLREEWTNYALEAAGETTGREVAADHAGRVRACRTILAKIRERKPNDESV